MYLTTVAGKQGCAFCYMSHEQQLKTVHEISPTRLRACPVLPWEVYGHDKHMTWPKSDKVLCQ